MRVCARCRTPRNEQSFYAEDLHPRDVCKPCIHRPSRPDARGRGKIIKQRLQRAQDAIRYVVKTAQSDEQSFVYLLRAGRWSKIGFSTNVGKRIRQLSTGSSAPIELIAVVPGGRQLEQELHREFPQLRRRGEWFRDRKGVIPARFAQLPSAMVFLPGYVQETSLLGGTE